MLTLTADPDDDDISFPLDPGQRHGESHLHRSSLVETITSRMRSRIT